MNDRQAFEKWAEGPKLPLRRDGRFESAVYCEYLTHLAWIAWQAATAAERERAAKAEHVSIHVFQQDYEDRVVSIAALLRSRMGER